MKKIESDWLYSKTFNDKIRCWRVVVSEVNNITHVTKFYSYIDGKLSTSVEVINSVFNINNATTIVYRLTELKRNAGYRNLTELKINTDLPLEPQLKAILKANKFDKNDIAKPMKAQPFVKNAMLYPCFLQPKLNGVRCVISVIEVSNGLFGTERKVSITSKDGITYNVPHIEREASVLLKDFEYSIDGELYHHSSPAPTIAGASKNVNNPVNSKLEFICFDLAIPDTPQDERLVLLKDLFDANPNMKHIKMIETIIVESDDATIEKSMEFIDKGFEGGIIRDLTSPYYFGGRRKNMMKIKKFIIGEFQIIDVIPFRKNPALGLFVCMNDINREVFESTPIGNNEQREEYLTNKFNYIGRTAIIKYYERTINGIPFHNNTIEVR